MTLAQSPRKRKVRCTYDPLNRWICQTWGNINKHTINPVLRIKPNQNDAIYLKNGTELQMTRVEFKTWCYANRELINATVKPSIDRIDNNGHYSINNIRILPHSENCKQGGRTQRLRNTELKESLKSPCPTCKSPIIRRKFPRWEKSIDFSNRKYCNRKCAGTGS